MVMKNSRIVLGCLISIMFAAAASAQWIPETNSVPLSSLLQGNSLIFGDKEISGLELFGLSDGGASNPNFNMVFIQGGQNSVTGDYGLKFNFFWNVLPNQTINAVLNFKVSVLAGYDDYFIKDVGLDVTGVSANGSGGVFIGEEVWDEPFYTPPCCPIATLSCSKWQGSSPTYLVDHAEFAPVKEIWIHSKAITLTGGTNGSASLSEFYQFYSQTHTPVPEPATIMLVGFAGAVMLRRRKRA